MKDGVCPGCGWITNSCPVCRAKDINLKCGCGTGMMVKRAGIVGPLLGGLGGLAIGTALGHPFLGAGIGAGTGYVGEKLLNSQIANELIKYADQLDKEGKTAEADRIDILIKQAYSQHPYLQECKILTGCCPGCGANTGNIDRMSVTGELLKYADLLREGGGLQQAFDQIKEQAQGAVQNMIGETNEEAE